jgi:hypothetical protein
MDGARIGESQAALAIGRWSSWRRRARDKTDQEQDHLRFLLDPADDGVEGGGD